MRAFVLCCVSAVFALPNLSYGKDCVVLLHGLGRSAWSMQQIDTQLQKVGYWVVNQSYRSRETEIERLALVVGQGLNECAKYKPQAIHFVTHSLGGILVRVYFQQQHPTQVKRIVMLGAPNHGSEIVDKYKDRWWFKWLTGSAGQQLGTEANSLPNRLHAIPYEIGIIAGTSSSDPWFTHLFTGANDGKVSVASTKLDEMKDFIEVESGHTFMANSRHVIRQIQAFLATGAFNKTTSVSMNAKTGA
ncbi:alpha/beta fold hydrolase [Agitococcus lubricus]|uniref:Alpha/beta hydrolase family protein n=1 Tax=Agitococcus lubricus TaxID=1077255 RepID=A0A2T5J1Q5_9GAMM|nr:alpha/beta fold hydrolase [Agitococcus lubricus]PTQ90328.1 hypothetical protein C8N29_10381 [Agitococcus lubricus]